MSRHCVEKFKPFLEGLFHYRHIINIPKKLLREKEQLFEKKKAAQSTCNIQMAEQYRILLEAIEKQIMEAGKKK